MNIEKTQKAYLVNISGNYKKDNIQLLPGYFISKVDL